MDTWILIGYLIGWFLSWPLCAVVLVRFMLAEFNEKKPDSFDLVMGTFLGAVAAFFWPLAVPGFWVVHVIKAQLADDAKKARR